MSLSTCLYITGGLLSFCFSSFTIFTFASFLSFNGSEDSSSTDSGALLWDLLLLSIFILQHSLMKRSKLKEKLKDAGFGHLERTLYVTATNICLLLLITFWKQSPGNLWHLETGGGPLPWLLPWLHSVAWYLVYCSALLLDLPELLGLRQLAEHCGYNKVLLGDVDPSLTRLYQHMRHPSFSALAFTLLARPLLSLDRALLACVLCGYMYLAWNPDMEDLKYQQRQWRRKKDRLTWRT